IRHLFLRSTESTEGTEGSVFLRALRVPPCPPRPLLAHGPERLEAAVDALQRRVGVALLLDDVPLGPADGLAQLEDRLPGHVALADQGLVVGGGVLLEVDGGSAAGVAADEGRGLGAGLERVAGVE